MAKYRVSDITGADVNYSYASFVLAWNAGKFGAGDIIEMDANSICRTHLDLDNSSNGAQDDPIIIRSYNGGDPYNNGRWSLYGSEGGHTWTDEGSDVWSTDVSALSNINGVYILSGTEHQLDYNAAAGAAPAANDWDIVTNTLYLHSTIDPNGITEINVRDKLMDIGATGANVNDVIIKDFDARYSDNAAGPQAVGVGGIDVYGTRVLLDGFIGRDCQHVVTINNSSIDSGCTNFEVHHCDGAGISLSQNAAGTNLRPFVMDGILRDCGYADKCFTLHGAGGTGFVSGAVTKNVDIYAQDLAASGLGHGVNIASDVLSAAFINVNVYGFTGTNRYAYTSAADAGGIYTVNGGSAHDSFYSHRSLGGVWHFSGCAIYAGDASPTQLMSFESPEVGNTLMNCVLDGGSNGNVYVSNATATLITRNSAFMNSARGVRGVGAGPDISDIKNCYFENITTGMYMPNSIDTDLPDTSCYSDDGARNTTLLAGATFNSDYTLPDGSSLKLKGTGDFSTRINPVDANGEPFNNLYVDIGLLNNIADDPFHPTKI